MIDWIENYGNNCWMSIFYNNHDNPRMGSKISKDSKYHVAIQKLLVVMQMTLKGTPFIFQGEEMGLVNYAFTSMNQITDVEAKGYYEEHILKKSHREVFDTIVAGTREHCRVLLPWNDKLPSYHEGLEQEINEEVLDFYKEMIKLRQSDKALVYGDFTVLDKKKNCFTYVRKHRDTEYLIDCNLGKEIRKAYPAGKEYRIIMPSEVNLKDMLGAYEARIYIK